MISEEQLEYWKKECGKYIFRDLESPDVILQLIAEVRELEASRNRKTEKLNELIAMIDWLASECETLSGYNSILRQGMTKTQWREAAYKAVHDV